MKGADILFLRHDSVSPPQRYNHWMGQALGMVPDVWIFPDWVPEEETRSRHPCTQGGNPFHQDTQMVLPSSGVWKEIPLRKDLRIILNYEGRV